MFGSYYAIQGFGAGPTPADIAQYAAGARAAGMAAAQRAAQTAAMRQAQQRAAAQASQRVQMIQNAQAQKAAQMAAAGRPGAAARLLMPVPQQVAAQPVLVTRAGVAVPVPPGMIPVPAALPQQVYSATPPQQLYTPTRVYSGFGGFGADVVAFDAAGIWNDWVAGAGGDNAAGKRAAQHIQAALAQLGYTDSTNKPLVVDGSWGPKSGFAYQAFSTAQGTTQNGINPTQDGIAKIGELLNAGVKPGPGPAVTYHEVGGVLVPTAVGGKKAGISTGMMIGIGAAAAIVIGGLALAGKKKPEHHSSGPSAVMVANRRRRARRHAFGF